MEEIIQKLKTAHDSIMCITLSAKDSVVFGQGVLLLREAIADLEKEKKDESDRT